MAIELLDYISINNYAINLVNDQQLFYSYIYNLSLVELKILKTYIENNLANSIIKFFKFFVWVSIFYDQKPDKSLQLYIIYQSFNNLTINNQYSLFLIRKLLDRLSQA